jgi:hypothetical protein
MNKLPKKIWANSHEIEGWEKKPDFGEPSQYIRSDLVDELVSLLIEWKNVTAEENKAWDEYEERIDAAIKELEDF